jgi:hypothetical protein
LLPNHDSFLFSVTFLSKKVTKNSLLKELIPAAPSLKQPSAEAESLFQPLAAPNFILLSFLFGCSLS